MKDWKSTRHSADSQAESQDRARERAREAEQDANERRCRCDRPVRDLRSYFGVHPCRLCGFLINPNGGGV